MYPIYFKCLANLEEKSIKCCKHRNKKKENKCE